jgi:hypothetical protein
VGFTIVFYHSKLACSTDGKILSAGGSPLINIINLGEVEMTKFIIGAVLGFFVSTYGVAGVAQMVDRGVEMVKRVNIKVEK